jgi:hypothetical protein
MMTLTKDKCAPVKDDVLHVFDTHNVTI